MLKLLKHDIKDSWLEIVILNGIVLVLGLLVSVGFKVGSSILATLTFLAFGITVLAAFGTVIMSIIRSFHKKLFTDYGYLTLTTPVSLDKILLSKIIVNMLWLITTVVSIVISLVIFTAFISSNPSNMLSGFFKLVSQNRLEIFKVIVMGLISALYFMTMLIFVLVLINMGSGKRYKLLKGLLIYVVVSIVVSLSNPFQSLDAFSLASFATRGISAFIINKTADYILGLVINLAWGGAFYFVSRYLIINKLELE